MSFDPDKDSEGQTIRLEELLEEQLIELRRIAKLLEILAGTEVEPEDVEE